MYWMDLYNGILCCGFLCARLISVSLFRLPRRGLPRPTDTLRLPRRGLYRPYRYIEANRLPRLQGYYAPYKRLGIGGLSHLRVDRPTRQCFHNNNNNNFSTELGAHRTDPLNTLAISNNSEASLWMVARPCVGPDLLYRERTCLTVGSGTVTCLLYTSPSPRDKRQSRMPSSA